MGYKLILASISSYHKADLSLGFVIRWATVSSGKENDTSVIMKNGRLHFSAPQTENAGIISRFNEKRVLDAIYTSPKLGNIWFDYGDKDSEVSLVFTIVAAVDAGRLTRHYYVSPRWQNVLSMAEQRLALDHYQELLAGDNVKGGIQKELVVVIEYLIDLLERQGCNVRNLPVNWKEYQSGVLFGLFKETEIACRSRLLKKITSLGAWAK